MPEPRTSTPDDEQLTRFREVSLATMDELRRAEREIRRRMLNAIDPGQRAGLRADAAELAADQEKIFARLLALEAGRLTISPPTPGDVTAAIDLARRLDTLIANNATANAVIEGATALFKQWSDMA